MDHEWKEYIADNCDVVVSLVRRTTNISAATSTYQGFPAMDEKEARKRKRLSNPEEEQNLGDLHINSGRVRRCSKYFDACLSERWAGAEISRTKMPVHLTLDVHTDVKYYRECFSRMHSSKYKQIPNVRHCLKLLQVASQISYLDLVEDCVRYLTSIPWSHEDEKGIRQFANSVFYPSDCAADLSARLGLPLSNTQRHGLLLDITVDALCKCFDDAVTNNLQDDILTSYTELFSGGFRVIIDGPCQTLAENVLKHVNDSVKKILLEAKEHPELNEDPGFYNVRWILRLLLETGSAKGLVEYIVEESPLSEMLQKASQTSQLCWVDPILGVFEEVIEGRLLLKTSTRYMLLQDWRWILGVGSYGVEEGVESGIQKTLTTFVKTFPYETQKEILSDWVAYYGCQCRLDFDLNFLGIFDNWIASLQEKISSLEP